MMKKSKLLCSLAVLVALMTAWIDCKAYQTYDKHVIISLDDRSDLNAASNWDANKARIGSILPQMLRDNGIDSGVMSTITFSVLENESSVDKYTGIVDATREFSSADDAREAWRNLAAKRRAGDGNRYSLLSIAKPYSLMALRPAADNPDPTLAKRTFLVLITDRRYNGNDDFNDELRKHPIIGKKPAMISGILGNVKEASQNYFFDFLGQKELLLNYGNKGYVTLFECIPQQKYFALESVANFPHEVEAKRTKSGYEVQLPVESFNNPNYELLEITAIAPDKTETIDGFGTMNFKLDGKVFANSDTAHVDLRATVRLLDGVYDRTVLTPDGSELAGAKGLQKRVIVKKEPNAKILGFIPLGSLLFKASFWTDNQHTAAAVWGIILILALVVTLIVIIRYSLKNKPDGEFTVS